MEDTGGWVSELGYSITDLGTHSIRKGASTYATSGSADGPTATSVYIRCGWSMGDVVDRYLQYEKAGDMFVGRLVSGLPHSSAKFALLPPCFICPSEAHKLCVRRHVEAVFGRVLRPEWWLTLTFCLASLLYHVEHLRKLGDDARCVRNSLLLSRSFTDITPVLFCGCCWEEKLEGYTCTGLPSWAKQMAELAALRKEQIDSRDIIVDRIKHILEEELDKRQVNGVITEERINSIVVAAIAPFINLLNEMRGQVPTGGHSHDDNVSVGALEEGEGHVQAQAQALEEGQAFKPKAYYYGGMFHKIPEGYMLPLGIAVLPMWRLWCCPNFQSHIPPLRTLQG